MKKKYIFVMKTILPVIAIVIAILANNSQTQAASTMDATLTSMKIQVSEALDQANLAKSATSLTDKKNYAENASALISGTGGVLDIAFAASIQIQGSLDSATASGDADAIAYTTTIKSAITNVSTWSASSIDAAGQISSAGTSTMADIYIGPGGSTLISGLEASLNGWGSAPGISQAKIASANLSGIVISGANLPITGEPSLNILITLLAVFGVVFIGAGTSFIYASSKSRA